MQIRCPECNELCEAENEPAIGQHVICPFCGTKFAYKRERMKTLLPTSHSCLKPTYDKRVVSKARQVYVRPRSALIAQEFKEKRKSQAIKTMRKLDVTDYGDIPSHLLGAVILLLFLLPIGVAALIYAVQVDSRKNVGDIEGAQSASDTAGTLVKVGIIIAFILHSIIWYNVFCAHQEAVRIEREAQKEIERANRVIESLQYEPPMQRIYGY